MTVVNEPEQRRSPIISTPNSKSFPPYARRKTFKILIINTKRNNIAVAVMYQQPRRPHEERVVGGDSQIVHRRDLVQRAQAGNPDVSASVAPQFIARHKLAGGDPVGMGDARPVVPPEGVVCRDRAGSDASA